MNALKQIASEFWVAETHRRIFGILIPLRMSAVRLDDGSLWLHSPVPLDEGLRDELSQLGSVSTIVAPNRWHHLSIAEYASAFPNAQFLGAPGLAKKKPKLKFHAELSEQPSWPSVLEQVLVKGVPIFNETAFLHKPSKTLLVSDLGFNVGESSPWLTRFCFKLAGASGKYSLSKDYKWFVKDEKAFSESLAKIRVWDFDRIVMGHGDIVEQNAKAAFDEAFAKYLAS